MDVGPIHRVRRRRKELSEKIAALEKERDRLDAYLEVHEEFRRPGNRTVSGQEIDALCQMVLRRAETPMTPSQLVDALKEQFGAVIEATSPARLVSTRMSTLGSVESAAGGWRLVTRGVDVESEAFE